MALSSAKLFNHIRELPLTRNERDTALYIASFRNEETFLCNPTQEELASLLGLKQQHVSKIISRLRKKKILQSVGVETSNEMRKFRNHYGFYFDWEEVEHCAMLPGFKGSISILCGVGEKIRNGNGNRLVTFVPEDPLACKQKNVLTPMESEEPHPD